MNNPIQVVLNSNSYIVAEPPVHNGPAKDFYKSDPAGFARHKLGLISQIQRVKAASLSNRYSKVVYAKVKMRSDALAKSYRPTQDLFNEKAHCDTVGAMKIGEMIIEFDANAADNAITRINRVSDSPNGKLLRRRSEIGAVESVRPITMSDRIPFTIDDSLNWINTKGYGTGYLVELQRPLVSNDTMMSSEKKKMFDSFSQGLNGFSNLHISTIKGNCNNSILSLLLCDVGSNRKVTPIIDPSEHSKLLDFLGNHPLVKRVSLSPIISYATPSGFNTNEGIDLDCQDDISSFPKVGIIDNGVSKKYIGWIIRNHDFVPERYRSLAHGSDIAGLLVKGQSINGNDICKEADGCQIADICLLPNDSYFNNVYPFGLSDFFTELHNSIEETLHETGTRIYNLSMNLVAPASSAPIPYSVFAQECDRIADELGVVFVISAGNLDSITDQYRQEWDPSNPQFNIEQLKGIPASAASPAESVRNISVIALNPKNLTPTVYTKIGPAIKLGTKPDVAHIGGSADEDSGLYSADLNGIIHPVAGTSFAAPIVSKTLACIENQIEGNPSKELLKALLLHNTEYPAVIQDKAYNGIKRNVYGYGLPMFSGDILGGNPNAITLVFANRIRKGQILNFKFQWPQCLISESGKCRGFVKLTLVASPTLDSNYGEEFIRENVTAYLRKPIDEGKHVGLLKSFFDHNSYSSPFANEEELIGKFDKWHTVKKTYANITRASIEGEIVLVVEYRCREGFSDSNGVPFAAILTIEDPKRAAPVYDQIRNSLLSTGVQLADIRIANRVTQQI